MNIGGLLLGICIAAFFYAFLRPRGAEEDKAGEDLVPKIEATPEKGTPFLLPPRPEKSNLKESVKSAPAASDAPAASNAPAEASFDTNPLRGSTELKGKKTHTEQGWGGWLSFFNNRVGI